MAISLQKGQKIDLHKKDGSQLTNLMVGLGWKEVQQKGGLLGLFKQKEDVDIDASVIMLNANGKFHPKKRLSSSIIKTIRLVVSITAAITWSVERWAVWKIRSKYWWI